MQSTKCRCLISKRNQTRKNGPIFFLIFLDTNNTFWSAFITEFTSSGIFRFIIIHTSVKNWNTWDIMIPMVTLQFHGFQIHKLKINSLFLCCSKTIITEPLNRVCTPAPSERTCIKCGQWFSTSVSNRNSYLHIFTNFQTGLFLKVWLWVKVNNSYLIILFTFTKRAMLPLRYENKCTLDKPKLWPVWMLFHYLWNVLHYWDQWKFRQLLIIYEKCIFHF